MKLRTLLIGTLAVASARSMAHTLVFTGIFSGALENPPNASPGTGVAIVTVDTDLFTMRTQATFSGLTGNTTASHIHVATAPLINGGVATQTPSFVGFPLGVTSGTYDQTFDMTLSSSYNAAFITNNGGSVGTAFTALVNALEQNRAYFNIHTTTFAGGEIRANLTAVPEPATMIALGAGLAVLARRRKQS